MFQPMVHMLLEIPAVPLTAEVPHSAGRPSLVRAGWAAAGLKDTLLRCEVKPEVVYGNEKAVQPRVQA